MKLESVGNQRGPDQHQKRQRQHLWWLDAPTRNFATGPDDTYMMTQAITTAAIMMARSCAMPIAVIMESSENTMSMTMI